MARREILLPWDQQPQEAVSLSAWAVQNGFKEIVLPSAGPRMLSSGIYRSSGSGTPTNENGPLGQLRRFANSSDYYFDGGELDPTSGYVWVWVGNWSSVGNWSGMISRTQDILDTQGWAWQRRSGGNELAVYHNLDSVTLSTIDDKLSSTPAVWVGGWDKQAGVARLFGNGSLVASAAFTTDPSYTANTGAIKLAASRDTSATSAVCYLAAFAIGRGPTDELAAAIAENPWRLLESQQIYVPGVAAAVAPTLLAASAVSIGATYATPRVTFSR